MYNKFKVLLNDTQRIKSSYNEIKYNLWFDRIDTLAVLSIRKNLFDDELKNIYIEFDNAEKSRKIDIGKRLLDDIIKYANSQL